MQSTRARLRGAALVTLVLGLLGLPAVPATAATLGLSPTLEVAAATCDLHGATDILVRAGGLEKGERYTVSVEVASDHTPIDARTVSGDTPTVSLMFDDLPNGDTYLVSIANTANTVGASASVSLPVCDLPTLPFDDPTATVPITDDGLALTGAAPLIPAMGGMILIQFGVVLLGIAFTLARNATSRRAP